VWIEPEGEADIVKTKEYYCCLHIFVHYTDHVIFDSGGRQSRTAISQQQLNQITKFDMHNTQLTFAEGMVLRLVSYSLFFILSFWVPPMQAEHVLWLHNGSRKVDWSVKLPIRGHRRAWV
jgi:hypothetical protein